MISERQARRVEAGRAEHALDLGGEARLGDLAARDVDADPELRPPRMSALPFARLPARFGEHPFAELHHQPGLFRDGDEEIGQEHAPARMPPARERLEPDHRAGVEIHDRLVEGDDLSPLDRASQIGLEPQRGDRALVHVAGEDLVAGATAHLCPVHRRVRVPQHVLGALVARARQRDADADAGEHLGPPHLQRGGHLLVNSLGHARGVRLGADVVEQDGELVTAEPRERIAGANAALEPARRRAQDLVTDRVPEAVIDRLETIEIEVEHREPRIAQERRAR